MSRNLALTLNLMAKDSGSKVLRAAMQEASKQVQQLEKAQQRSSETGIRASKTLTDEYRRASQARSTLGIRSERQIQREIQQTTAAYNRLTRTGLLSANEQARAFDAMRQRVTLLRGELSRTSETMSRMSKARLLGGNLTAVAGGVAAAGAVLAQPVREQMNYSQRLANITNTAYNQLPADERIVAKEQLSGAIKGAVRKGGGTADTAANALGVLMSKGGVDDKTAMSVLGDVMYTSTATNSNPEEIAQLAVTALNNFKIKKEELPLFFDKLTRSGELGGFELSNMAKELPTIMTNYSKLGMGGLKDIDLLLGNLQANSETSGNNDTAANNLNQLLLKITSADTINNMKNRRFRVSGGKEMSYADFIVSQRANGKNTFESFINAIDSTVSNDKRYKRYSSDIERYKGTDKEKDLRAARDVLVSTIIASIVPDAQAQMALTTSFLKKDYINDQMAGTNKANGAVTSSFQVMASEPLFKFNQLANEKFFADGDVFIKFNKNLGDAALTIADYAKEYPALTVAVDGATEGIKAMTAAAYVFAGIRLLQGGVGLPPSPEGAAGTGGKLARALSITTPAIAITAGSVALGAIRDKMRDDFDKKTMPEKIESIKNDTSGYSFVDIAWAVLKSRFGDEKRQSSINAPRQPDGGIDIAPGLDHDGVNFGLPSYLQHNNKLGFTNDYQAESKQPLIVKNQIILDEKVLAEAVNNFNGEQANRGSGTPNF
ncbi:phage tail tape measure protein [Enterobacter roggenkampii]|uniref:phage tail tape measure protein n=2 Tax=Enterobacter TaxID=547 RepID=UPI000664DB55|nr:MULTISPECIES: phage tail tape measure protein [Enterobacter cloacae complex]EDH8434193.1 phage tail tape measure protein [Salmonella enterica subsp. enterica serovar Schwarzengrund]EDL4838483.1 phage tail tape measure protein [Salmonella enterica subsp. enterica serovar Schwarzengrund]ELD8601407.1 phage tail tape measure protein [Enterobacter roggenkampii]MCU3129336.1 phage tail tape measure protein [Enterobacter roggenkampii]